MSNFAQTQCPKCHDVLSIDARACACGWRKSPAKAESSGPNLMCPWNDHGRTCGERGSMSDGMLGSGPWYCSTHYWQLKGRTVSDSTAPVESYRARWYAERGLPYEPPKSTSSISKFAPKRQREPGEDSPEDIGEAA